MLVMLYIVMLDGPVLVDHAHDDVVVVAVVAVELGVEDADLGLAGAVEAQRHQRVGQPLVVAALVEVPSERPDTVCICLHNIGNR